MNTLLQSESTSSITCSLWLPFLHCITKHHRCNCHPLISSNSECLTVKRFHRRSAYSSYFNEECKKRAIEEWMKRKSSWVSVICAWLLKRVFAVEAADNIEAGGLPTSRRAHAIHKNYLCRKLCFDIFCLCSCCKSCMVALASLSKLVRGRIPPLHSISILLVRLSKYPSSLYHQRQYL